MRWVVQGFTSVKTCILHVEASSLEEARVRYEEAFTEAEREGVSATLLDLESAPWLARQWRHDGYRRFHSGFRYE